MTIRKPINLQYKNDRQIAIQEADQLVTSIGKIVHRPPGKIIAWALGIIRIFEEKNVNRIIEKLEA